MRFWDLGLRAFRLGLRFGFWDLRVEGLPAPPNYPVLYPKYPLLRTIRALLKGTWGVLVGFRSFEAFLGLRV